MKTNELTQLLHEKLSKVNAVSFEELNITKLYHLCAMTVNDLLLAKRKEINGVSDDRKLKKVYYLSMEFLIGKSLQNNISNLDLEDSFTEIVNELGYKIEDLYGYERDAGLGNGGLGRLAACFFDSLASQQYPAIGYSLLYEYGLFKQEIINGWQQEVPDRWLPSGEVWLNPVVGGTVEVMFDGYLEEVTENNKTKYLHHEYQLIEATPYDIVISGVNKGTSTLRLWKSRANDKFDFRAFNDGDYQQAMKDHNEANLLTKVLYPSDNHYQGKILRLMQQYFLVSASIQNIIAEYFQSYDSIENIFQHVAIHINDTHPALAIPELIRILIDDYNLDFKMAWKIVTQTFSYTNHTVMAEALERWPIDLVRKKTPRIYIIIKQINQQFVDELRELNVSQELIDEVVIIHHGEIRMANLCVYASHKINGVSKLHSNIIKASVFNGFNQLYPQRFTNVTNGIAYRRWLVQSNPKLCHLLDRLIGPEYRINAKMLIGLLEYQHDNAVLEEVSDIKFQNKVFFSNLMKEQKGLIINPHTRFDVQVKRIHEYKRQLLNILKIIYLLCELEENPELEMTPQTFIFGGKAAPGYFHAKQIIELINYLSFEIDSKPKIKEKLDVVYIEDYNVSIAEKLFPASDVSQQISMAGKEASGTGNMKFMINGALTFGTLDGANVEITEEAGEENVFIFGLKADEVRKLDKKGYNPYDIYASNLRLIKVIDRLNKGFMGKSFDHISRYLLTDYHPDPFKCIADFDSYLETHYQMDEIYQNKKKWHQMALVNIAHAGFFSADRSISEYCEKIWNIQKVKI